MQLSRKYEVERMEGKNSDLRKKLAESGRRQRKHESFIEAMRKFMRMDSLNSPLLRELIDHIDIIETEGTGKSRNQRIVTYYRLVGYIKRPGRAGPKATKPTHARACL